MKVLLIKPPGVYTNLGFKNGPAIGIPIGLLHIASVLEKEGIKVKVFDANVEILKNRPYFHKNSLIYFGADDEQTRKVILQEKPDFVGISNSFSSHLKSTFETADIVKETNRKIKIIVGGPHATILPQTFFEESENFDYVIRGEGELSLLELIRNIEKGKENESPNIYSRKDFETKRVVPGKIEYIQDIDSLPLPSYHLIDLEKYFYIDEIGYPPRVKFEYPGSCRAVSVCTSRGCPYKCTFCSVHLHMGRKFRPFSIDYVIKHINLLTNKYGVKHIHFEDDAINLDKKRFNTLLDNFRNLNRKITWDTPNGLRAEGLDEETLRRCIDSGCIYLIIGIESSVPRVLSEVIRKNLSLRVADRALELANKIGLDMGAFFLMGFPDEKLEEIKQNCEYALYCNRKYNTSLHMHLVTPLPGTDLYNTAIENGCFAGYKNTIEMSEAAFYQPLLKSNNYSREELLKILHWFERTYILLIIRNFLLFIFKYPLISLRVFFYELKQLLKRSRPVQSFFANLYLRHFLHKNALLRHH